MTGAGFDLADAAMPDAHFDLFCSRRQPSPMGLARSVPLRGKLQNNFTGIVGDNFWRSGPSAMLPVGQVIKIGTSPVDGAAFNIPELPDHDRSDDEEEKSAPIAES